MKSSRLVVCFTAAFVLSSLGLAEIAQANSTRIYRDTTISLEQALERSSIRAKSRRPGLGAYTRRAHSYQRSADEQTTGQSQRRTTNRVFGGRNGYARYLRSKSTDNSQRVSRLRPGRVDASQAADTEANTR